MRSHLLLGIKTHLRSVFEFSTQKDIKENDKKEEKGIRSPFNLAVVLDRSGSMSSHSRLLFARNAILEVINHLIPEDRFHFITYDDNATKLIQDGQVSD